MAIDLGPLSEDFHILYFDMVCTLNMFYYLSMVLVVRVPFVCYDVHNRVIFIGGIVASHVKVHVNALPTSPPLIDIDLSPTQITIIAIVGVFFLLVVVGISYCCIRGLPGRGKNRLREDNPMNRSNGWPFRAEVSLHPGWLLTSAPDYLCTYVKIFQLSICSCHPSSRRNL